VRVSTLSAVLPCVYLSSRLRAGGHKEGWICPASVGVPSTHVPDSSASAPVVGYMGPFQLKKGQEIEFTPVAKRKRMSYMK
jgi:hypothetical protein